MKFTLEELQNTLEARLTPNGRKTAFSPRTLDETSSALYAFIEKHGGSEAELEDAVNDLLPVFESVDGNVRFEKAAFAREYAAAHEAAAEKKKTEKPAEETKQVAQKPSDAGSDRALIEKMQAQLQELLDKQKADDDKRAVSGKRSAIVSLLKDKKVSNDDWVKTQLSLINVTPDTDENDIADKLVDLYNKSKAVEVTDVTPGTTGGAPTSVDPAFARIRAAREAEIKRNQEQL